MKCSLVTLKKFPGRAEKPHKKSMCKVNQSYALLTSTTCVPLNHCLLDIGPDMSSKLELQRCQCSGFRAFGGDYKAY